MPRTLPSVGTLLANFIALGSAPLLVVAGMYASDWGVPMELLVLGGAVGGAIPTWVGWILLTHPEGVLADPGTGAEILGFNEYIPAPTTTPTSSGFDLSLAPPYAPSLAWLRWRIFLWGTVGLGILVAGAIIHDRPPGEPLLQFGIAFSWFAMLAYIACLAPGFMSIPILGGVFARSLNVQLHGHTLRTGEESFTVGMPGQTLRLEFGRRGHRLVLENAIQTLVLPGRHTELVWLKQQLEALPLRDGADSVPPPLRVLASATKT